MPYVAEHKESCKNKDRYIIRSEIVVIENRRGAILDNSDRGRGKTLSIQCESCHAPAKWK